MAVRQSISDLLRGPRIPGQFVSECLTFLNLPPSLGHPLRENLGFLNAGQACLSGAFGQLDRGFLADRAMRLLKPIGDMPPVEKEGEYYRKLEVSAIAA